MRLHLGNTPWVPSQPTAHLPSSCSGVFACSGSSAQRLSSARRVSGWIGRVCSSKSRRAVAIDMESATIAANGYRYRVPYGTLLCVSDKPLHGEIKLPGQANKFYEEAIAAHLQIGVTACRLLRDEGPSLHSRKLRAFNEPPFR